MYLLLISQQSFAGLLMFWQLLMIIFCPLRLELEHPSNRVSIVCSTLCALHMVTSLQQTQQLSGYCQTGWDKASMSTDQTAYLRLLCDNSAARTSRQAFLPCQGQHCHVIWCTLVPVTGDTIMPNTFATYAHWLPAMRACLLL